MSKGSWQRPRKVSYEEYADNWDRIFSSEQSEEQEESEEEPVRQALQERMDKDIKEGRAIRLTLKIDDDVSST